jgi:hypothetical protein
MDRAQSEDRSRRGFEEMVETKRDLRRTRVGRADRGACVAVGTAFGAVALRVDADVVEAKRRCFASRVSIRRPETSSSLIPVNKEDIVLYLVLRTVDRANTVTVYITLPRLYPPHVEVISNLGALPDTLPHGRLCHRRWITR